MCAKLKKTGKGAVVPKELLSDNDLHNLYSSLDLETPTGLQNNFFLDYMLYFCNRGREHLRDIKHAYVGVRRNTDGALYVY